VFGYKQFENELVIQMENTLNQILKEYNDIYIFSLDIASNMASAGIIANTVHNLEKQAKYNDEDYYYYKYCEEEWDIWESGNFGNISNKLRQCLEINGKDFTKDNYIYTNLFYRHCEKIIESCGNALIRFSSFKNSKCPDLLLALNINEILEEEKRIEIFTKLNNKEAAAEYSKHISEFI